MRIAQGRRDVGWQSGRHSEMATKASSPQRVAVPEVRATASGRHSPGRHPRNTLTEYSGLLRFQLGAASQLLVALAARQLIHARLLQRLALRPPAGQVLDAAVPV